ncbi:glycoside hydrolase family 1 protein [Paenibacillus whitsoniae]|uniref:Glycosyl hydrolase family protein n=1 Tax=Paenibacillus whitsoniae TaxID=2496558 RepID=A0A3S0ABL0_9BACL|nr:family 1 glycosylhydrolase [Paenibacillus whitsoniae]RTE09198.1 glycosyl hydrolase family protein [Paenibacillus whitsoniae]
MAHFPEGFLWGASTAAHQVEGNNTNSDFWLMENLEGSVFAEPSGSAVDHYIRFKEDIAEMAKMGLNAYRFSLEWARIEPEEGQYDAAEIAHYRDVLLTCKEYQITPIVTLHHFSSPQWLIRLGGWESAETPAKFARYCTHVMRELGEWIPYVCTINEANISIGIKKIMKRYELKSGSPGAQVGMNMEKMAQMQKYYMELSKAFGVPPTEVHSFLAPRSEEGLAVIFQAHVAAREAIRQISPQTKVGVTLSLYDIQSAPGGEENAKEAWQEEFLQFVSYLQEDDFFGLQNYTRAVYGPDGLLPIPENAETTQMGNEYYPEALGAVVRYVSQHLKMPIMITENGVATDDDTRRVAFIDRALKGVHTCISDGYQILGYMHWSLMDNFEWQLGFSKRFGLIAVDRATQERTVKPSGYHLGNIARRNAI